MEFAAQRDRTRTRDRILSSAEDLLTSASARDVKVRDIAERAGVSASLVVQYFESRDALVLDVGLRRLGAPPTPAPAAGGLEAVVRWMAVFDLAHSELLREVMRQTWWFGTAAEAAFALAFAPRRDALCAVSAAGSPAGADVLMSAYFESLRKSFASNETGDDLINAAASAVIASNDRINA